MKVCCSAGVGLPDEQRHGHTLWFSHSAKMRLARYTPTTVSTAQ